jgi:hypothetical protein
MTSGKLILLIFGMLEWGLAWSVRYIPNRNTSSALLKGVLTLVLAASASGGVIAEVLLYRLLTGQNALKDDNFFIATMIAQGIGGIIIAFKSESVLRRREGETRLGN